LEVVRYSDHGVQFLSILYRERLAEAGVEPSVGTVGDSYDNAVAETIFGLFKAEVIWPNGPWKGLEEVAFAVLEWVIGSPTEGCSSRSVSSHRQNSRQCTTEGRKVRPRRLDATKRVFGKAGAVRSTNPAGPWEWRKT